MRRGILRGLRRSLWIMDYRTCDIVPLCLRYASLLDYGKFWMLHGDKLTCFLLSGRSTYGEN